MSRRIRRRRSASLASAVESLEGRVLLSAAFKVNTADGEYLAPLTAMDGNGAFLIELNQLYEAPSVHRYSASGSPLGQPTSVSWDGEMEGFSFAAAENGRFVTTYWMYDAGGGLVSAQLFESNGAARGSPIDVSEWIYSDATAVGMDADGDFVVAWTENYGSIVNARRFNAAGTAQGAAFQVNATPAAAYDLRVAMDADGDFIVAWSNHGYEPAPSPRLRRYNAAGVAQGKEVVFASATRTPAVDFDAAGNYYVAWAANHDVIVQRYNPAGKRMGKNMAIITAGEDIDPVVSAGPSGDWFLLWTSQGKKSTNLYLQRYLGASMKGKGVSIASAGKSASFDASASMSANGAFVAAWEDKTTNDIMAWHMPAPPPEIQVWSGTKKKAKELRDNQAAPVNFGTVTIKAAAPLVTFTVKNSGTGVLNLSGVTPPAGFEIVDPLVTSLAPGAWDVFTVRMVTRSAAKRSAFIRIANNDANENPFDILVQGEIKR